MMMRVTFPKLVFFDLDGTLIEPIDFERIKRVLGIEGPVLEKIQDDQEKLRILIDFEIDHAKKAKLMPYAKDVLEKLKEFKVKRVLITRNCLDSVKIICRRFKIDFDYIVTREMGNYKPSPYHIIRVMSYFGFDDSECLIVGDHYFDLLAGKRAGIKTALLLNGYNTKMMKYTSYADFIFRSLRDLLRCLK
jgi:HAD superfamily hydrolase (TIGR01549 family)